ncbi:MAG: pyruvate-ferredoxin/flavodoxin oxidoreductase, partial [Verrucomicrobiota bacterium]|nr:pyruvate-ferredoxin/flavodoxin oxidoreductase [Verrucomicrobiota bacterium]
APGRDDAAVAERRGLVEQLRARLADVEGDDAARLRAMADDLVARSVWIVGGDGWAYDIGFGGLDHVLASGRKVNILVLDTEVYSNTGGQKSKSTPLGAVAKFSAAGKDTDKKDLAMIAASYGGVYVARVAFGAKDSQTVQAFLEAEAHPGPSLIIAYSHCIAHGYSMANGLDQQKLAVETGSWPLFRHNPARLAEGKPAAVLDSGPPKQPLSAYTRNELRFQALFRADPERAKDLAVLAQEAVNRRFARYQTAAAVPPAPAPTAAPAAPAATAGKPASPATP